MREKRALSLFLLTIVVSLTSGFAGFQASNPPFYFWLWAGGPSVLVALLTGLYAHREGMLARWVRPEWGDFTRGFFAACALFGTAYVSTRVMAPLGTARESWLARLYLQLGDPAKLREHATWVAVAIVLFASAEEIVWRGFVPYFLAGVVGSRYAWMIAALLYGVSYLPTMWALRDPVAGLNPVLPLGALGGGLVWGAMARGFGRLAPGVIAHVLFDWAVVMMFRLWGMSV